MDICITEKELPHIVAALKAYESNCEKHENATSRIGPTLTANEQRAYREARQYARHVLTKLTKK